MRVTWEMGAGTDGVQHGSEEGEAPRVGRPGHLGEWFVPGVAVRGCWGPSS